MKAVDKVIKHYNGNQSYDRLHIKSIEKSIIDEWNVRFENYIFFKIGFYEWLFNPEYKVFDVFELYGCDITKIVFDKVSRPQEIINYLAEKANDL